MNKISEQIKEREELLGRKLTAGERYILMAQTSNLNPDRDWDIVSLETREGVELMTEYHKRLEFAKTVNSAIERHKIAHFLSDGKRNLLAKFRNNELTRIKPAEKAA